jgi:hypothetical protein
VLTRFSWYAVVLQNLKPAADVILLQEVTCDTLSIFSDMFEVTFLDPPASAPSSSTAKSGAPKPAPTATAAASTSQLSSSNTADEKKKKSKKKNKKKAPQPSASTASPKPAAATASAAAPAAIDLTTAAGSPSARAASAAGSALAQDNAEAFFLEHEARRKSISDLPLLAFSAEWIMIAPPPAYAHSPDNYYVIAFVRRRSVMLEHASYYAFQRSVMDRHMLKLTVTIEAPALTASNTAASAVSASPNASVSAATARTTVYIITSHLESLRGGSEFRLYQLASIFGNKAFAPGLFVPCVW